MVRRFIVLCGFSDCPNPAVTRGWCAKHYTRWRRHGDPAIALRGPENICEIPDCGRRVVGQHLCGKHYRNLRKLGKPIADRPRRPYNMTIEEFTEWFWKQLIVTEKDCREWPKTQVTEWYPQIGTNNLFSTKTERVHRVAWMLSQRTREIPESSEILHSCDNPPCCNPEHLRAGTPPENVNDRTERNRSASKLTADQVRSIRAELLAGTSQAALGRKYGVSASMISAIARGKNWKHIR